MNFELDKLSARLLQAGLAIAAVWAASAQAHDIVLEPQRDGVAVRYGHAQDWQQVQDGKLVDLQLLRGSEAPQDVRATLRPRRTDFVLPLPGGRQALLVAARYDNGLWARLPAVGGAKPVARNTTRVMLPEAALVTNNLKFAKALIVTADDTAVYRRTVGHLLELVPQRNPAGLKAGEPLEVLVLFKGQPQPDVEIEVSNLEDVPAPDKVLRFKSDAKGVARVALLPKGINTLGALFERPNDGSLGEASRAVGADKFVLAATLSFAR
jgi:nickel transport protein